MSDEQDRAPVGATRPFRCPGCKGVGEIDADMAAGRVSIECLQCGWHHTLRVPLADGAIEPPEGSWA